MGKLNIRAGKSIITLYDKDNLLTESSKLFARFGISRTEIYATGLIAIKERLLVDEECKKNLLKQVKFKYFNEDSKRYIRNAFNFANSKRSIINMLLRDVSLKTVKRTIDKLVTNFMEDDPDHKKDWKQLKRLKKKDLIELKENVLLLRNVGMRKDFLIDLSLKEIDDFSSKILIKDRLKKIGDKNPKIMEVDYSAPVEKKDNG